MQRAKSSSGLEKDLALVVAPEMTLPCASSEPPAQPPFANVALVPPGPFTVTVPIAARYDELAKAMSTVFTDGKYFFSSEFPTLYLENPEVYESQGLVVLKVHLKGPVHKFGIDADLEGEADTFLRTPIPMKRAMQRPFNPSMHSASAWHFEPCGTVFPGSLARASAHSGATVRRMIAA